MDGSDLESTEDGGQLRALVCLDGALKALRDVPDSPLVWEVRGAGVMKKKVRRK